MSTPNPRTITYDSSLSSKYIINTPNSSGYLGNGSTGLIIVGSLSDAIPINFKRYIGTVPPGNEPFFFSQEVFFICDGNNPNNYVGYDQSNGLVFGKNFSQATMFHQPSSVNHIYTPDNQFAIVNKPGIGLSLGDLSDAVSFTS